MPLNDNMANYLSTYPRTKSTSTEDNNISISKKEQRSTNINSNIGTTETETLSSSSLERIPNTEDTEDIKTGAETGSRSRIDDLQQQVYSKFKAIHETLKLKRNQYSFIHSEQPQQHSQSKNKTKKLTKTTMPTQLSSNVFKHQIKPNFSQNGKTTMNNGITKQHATKGHNAKLIPEKWHQELEAQINGFHKVLNMLIIEYPHLRPRISSIVESIPELKPFEGVFNRLEGGVDLELDECASTSKGSKCEPQDLFEEGPDDDFPKKLYNEDCTRKRGRRGKKHGKGVKATKNECNELHDLRKYINGIVNDYVKNNETLSATLGDTLCKFDGGFDDLEEYAKKLVDCGLGRIVEDELRVNRKNNRQSFITMSTDRETLERDGMVMLPVARRYAFEGDIVRAFVLNATPNLDTTIEKPRDAPKEPTEPNPDEDVLFEGSDSLDSDVDTNELLDTIGPIMTVNCPKSFVIEIVKHTDDRKAVGTISFNVTTQVSIDDNLYYKFRPLDTRMPLMYVPVSSGDVHAREAKERNDITDLFFVAQICQTDNNGHCIAELLQLVGKVGHLEHELKAILLHNGLKDIKPYEQRFCDLYADSSLPQLSETELMQRADLRKKCIFTIDPATARDLDDALSVEKLEENLYEVGVHIADVAYLLDEGSELDDIVKQRATSIYLVNEVIHMLPQTFCFKCSLLPGEDKLAFSVFWQMNRVGEVVGEPRFTRSIINSCTKFAYGHAQKFIDNPNLNDSNIDEFPDIYNGYSLSQVGECVQLLHGMARNMRRRRFDDGALSINNPKLRFELDPITGEPISYEIDKLQEANFMIEEFMLLANRSVAKHIYTSFPDISILRNHAPPLMTSMKTLQEKLSNLGLSFDCSSSKSVKEGMERICSEAENPSAMNACLSTLLTKPMARAKYICSEDKTESELWHYALSIPIYTHFTSPIRRYPDIMVHRLLAATLDYCSPPQRTTDELRELANVCNVQKFNAKNASDESAMLYFKRYVKTKQGIKVRAVVLEIHQHLMNVVTIDTGHVFPILYNAQKVIVDKSNAPSYIQISEKGSKQPPIQLSLFTEVKIRVVVRDEKFVAFFVSPDLKQRQINCIELNKSLNGQKNITPGRGMQRQEQRLQSIKQQQQNEHNLEHQMQTQTKQHKNNTKTIQNPNYQQQHRQRNRNKQQQRYHQERLSISEQSDSLDRS